MDKIICHTTRLGCSLSRAFELFTANKHLEKWLTKVADVEPWIGGKFELFWNPQSRANDSTVGCRILAITPNRLLCFEWKGPKQFKHFMNEVRPLTNVAVFFTPVKEGTEIHLLHTGWRDSAEWEEAREWFDKAWMMSLSELQNYAGNSENERP